MVGNTPTDLVMRTKKASAGRDRVFVPSEGRTVHSSGFTTYMGLGWAVGGGVCGSQACPMIYLSEDIAARHVWGRIAGGRVNS